MRLKDIDFIDNIENNTNLDFYMMYRNVASKKDIYNINGEIKIGIFILLDV